MFWSKKCEDDKPVQANEKYENLSYTYKTSIFILGVHSQEETRYSVPLEGRQPVRILVIQHHKQSAFDPQKSSYHVAAW